MSVSVFCLTHSNRLPFLRDFLKSFRESVGFSTNLYLGFQGCSPEMIHWLWQQTRLPVLESETCNAKSFVFRENIGLNRYNELVGNGLNFSRVLERSVYEVLAIADDDIVLPQGYEEVFESIHLDERFGWVGIPEKDAPLLKFPNGREWNINGYRIIEAAVGCHLAATRKDVWEEVGGLGQGRTIFDPEDARYQRKCIEAGYLTGVIVDSIECEHHNSWEWAIKYGTVGQKMENLRQAMLAEFIDETTYRLSLQEYLAVAEKQ